MNERQTTVALRPMQPDELEVFRATFIEDWAHDLSRVEDLPIDSSRAEAARRTNADLHGVFESDDHHLYTIVAGGDTVGTLWFTVANGRAFLDDITVAEAHRGNGYGRRALELMHLELRRLGARLVQLNVYAHNPRARALYEALGYEVTGLKMTKRFEPE